MVAPLTSLTKGGGVKINWGPKAAFLDLKHCFTSATILSIPNPERPFVVEMGASEVGVGATLSQSGKEERYTLVLSYHGIWNKWCERPKPKNLIQTVVQ